MSKLQRAARQRHPTHFGAGHFWSYPGPDPSALKIDRRLQAHATVIDTNRGRVEDAPMIILHLLTEAFAEPVAAVSATVLTISPIFPI